METMTDKEKIIQEIERRIHFLDGMVNTDFGRGSLDTLNKVLDFINSLPAEQPSEELEKAAKDFVEENSPYTDEFMLDNEVEEAYKIAELTFKRGAQWQKEQMMKSAIDGCYIKRNKYNKENVLNGLSVTCNAIQKFKDGDKVKVIKAIDYLIERLKKD